MSKSEKQILNVLQGKKPSHRPIWIMRQAGRYLPEYRKLRAKAENFLNLCLTPEWASEVTLQPIRRFDLDAAIIFADILLIPMALGVDLKFQEGEGPVLDALTDEKSLLRLDYNNKKLFPVYEALVRVKNELPRHTALIGFCGAPWTVACYMIDGRGKTGFGKSKQWAAEKPDLLAKLISILIDASEIYLSGQIAAGAEVLQIFDSWAGLLTGNDFERWVIEPTKELVCRIKRKYPHIPIIGFPREAGDGYRDYLTKTGIDALSIDQSVDLDYAKNQLQPIKPLQGNLDPALLVRGGEDMKGAISIIMEKLGPIHVFNLGHGVTPDTPPEHVAELVNRVRGFPV